MVLEIEGLTKAYGRGVVANDDVSLQVRAGEVLGLLGHNGAGKTTIVNQIVGIAKPDAGRITIEGVDAITRPAEARKRCAVQAQAQVPLTGLTPNRAIELVGRLRGGGRRAVVARRDALLERLDMGQWAERTSEHLSGGVGRLVSFCVAVVTSTPLVVLDEPTNDVDPVRRRLLWSEIRRLADEGAGVLLVTHNVNEAERAVDRLAILDEGRVVAQGTPGELTRDFRERLRLEIRFAPHGVAPTLPAEADVVAGRAGAQTAWVPATVAHEVVRWALAAQTAGQIETFALEPASLEDAYASLVGDEPDVAA
jgi:ABC-2 type transport system ATP-binding protein